MIKKRTLGRTGIEVGEVGIGCEGFDYMDEVQSVRAMDIALENGANFIDIYASNPKIRDNIGYALKGRRDKVVIQGHIGSAWGDDGQYYRTRSVAESRESFEDLLRRLDTDYIDIGMIHYCDEQADFEKIFNTDFIDYVKDLKNTGKIGYIGISSHNPTVAEKAVKTGLIDVVMFSINPCYDMLPPNEDIEVLFENSSYDREIFNMDRQRQSFYELCERENVAITVMKVFAGGVLLDEKQSPFGKAMSPYQCINYCLTRPGVVVALSGGHSPEEIEISVKYYKASDEEKDFSSILQQNPKYSFKGHCMYCGHCAPCTKGIDIAAVNKFEDLCLAQGQVIETAREHYLALNHHAGECVACGKCEKNCPFGVEIIEKMQKAKEMFGK